MTERFAAGEAVVDLWMWQVLAYLLSSVLSKIGVLVLKLVYHILTEYRFSLIDIPLLLRGMLIQRSKSRRYR